MWQFWLITAGFFVVLEIATMGFLVFWFAIGALAGAVVAVALIFLQFVLDNKIHSEEYLIEYYKYPILAVIPDLTVNSKNKYYKKKTTTKKKSEPAPAQTAESGETESEE